MNDESLIELVWNCLVLHYLSHRQWSQLMYGDCSNYTRDAFLKGLFNVKIITENRDVNISNVWATMSSEHHTWGLAAHVRPGNKSYT